MPALAGNTPWECLHFTVVGSKGEVVPVWVVTTSKVIQIDVVIPSGGSIEIKLH